MLVQENSGTLLIEATDDLQYFLGKISGEISQRKGKRPDTMAVVIDLTLHGSFIEELQLKLDSTEGRTAIPRVLKNLKSKGSTANMAVTGAKSVNTFYVEVKIKLQYVLGSCTGNDVADDVRNELTKLKNAGFSVKGIPKVEVEESEEA